MAHRWGQVAIAAALLTTLTQSVRADSLADARKAVDSSDYLAARSALDVALKSGRHGPAELADIYRLTGIVEGALGHSAAAEKAFARWLAIDPKGALPAGTSPKITRPFTAAQELIEKRGVVDVKAETNDDPPAVTLVVVNDPLEMIVGAKVYFVTDRKAEEALEATGKGRMTMELGTGKRIDLRLHAVDTHGNRVVELGSKDVPIVITSSGKEKQIDPKDRELLVTRRETAPATPRPWYFQWWLWGTATAVTTGVAGYFAWQTRSDLQRLDYLNANSLAYPWSEAQAAERSARRNLLITNIAAGTAGAFAAGTLVLYLTRPKVSVGELRATVTPTHDGGAVVVGGRF